VHVKAKGSVGRALKWGAGGFALGGGAALTLEGLEISGPIVAVPGASLELKHVTFAPGGCVRGQATLVDTPAPEICLFHVIFDGPDVDAFLASLGSGLPGTYVLRLAGEAQQFEVAELSVGPQQEVDFLSTAAGSSLRFTAGVRLAKGAAMTVNGPLSSVICTAQVDAAEGASVSLSLETEAVTFEGAVDMGDDSNLSIDGSIGVLSFPAGLHTGGTTSIRSSSTSSIKVEMGTTWYAVDPSSNMGSVTFGNVGLLSGDGETLIGSADGTLPGTLKVELNGLQPGGDGTPQSAAVLLGVDGTITVPPAVSAAVGQVFTDDRIGDFVSTVNLAAPGMYGLQLSLDGQTFEVDGLSVSSGQDVRIFSSATGSTLSFTGDTRIAAGGSVTVSGDTLMTTANIIAIAASSSMNVGIVSFHGGTMIVTPRRRDNAKCQWAVARKFDIVREWRVPVARPVF
jgi:hypothetical protein